MDNKFENAYEDELSILLGLVMSMYSQGYEEAAEYYFNIIELLMSQFILDYFIKEFYNKYKSKK